MHNRSSLTLALLAAAAVLINSVSSSSAKPVPDNLGNGLNKLVESQLILSGQLAAPPADPIGKPDGKVVVSGKQVPTYNGYATRQAAAFAAHAITDPATKNVMVDIHLSGGFPYDQVKQRLTSQFASLKITAEDPKYRNAGVIEGYVAVSDLVALSQIDGVRSAQLVLKPRHGRAVPGVAPKVSAGSTLNMIGSAFDQGVTQHRIDQINQIYNPSAPVNWDGSGMSIGCISDTFDTSGTAAASDVATRDLPGAGNSINSTPVTVLQDITDGSGTDEGRGMCQIAYKMAPRAHIGFATADTGEVGFANNIRALAALPGYTYPAGTQKGFKADTICDDVGYFDEPYFQTGVIGAAIKDVVAAGVSYFSSAGNDFDINGYDADLHMVDAATAVTGVAGTNLLLKNSNVNLTNVPANLYAGGFHNFTGDPNNPDFAQTVNVPTEAVLAQYLLTDFFLVFQWDDPYDSSTPVLNQPPIFTASGTITSTPPNDSVTYSGTSTPPLPPFTAGTEYVIAEHATSGNFDGQITVYDPNGNQVVFLDNGIDDTLYFFPQVTGQYSIKITAYNNTTGNFTLTINTANGHQAVTTDMNLLVFDMNGTYQASKSLTANNLASNQPVDLAVIMGDNSNQLQFVITRSNVPAGTSATHVRYLLPGDGIPNLGPNEYFTYGNPTSGGHAIVPGCNGTAAFSVFRPSIPEYFSSPGPGKFYFDDQGNRLSSPLLVQQPSIAAADGNNTSSFGSDSGNDSDSKPNFYGTSAAGPHAAAIAALVLQAHGGPGKVTPQQMSTILQQTAFPHDLDPFFATGTATTITGGSVTVSVHSDNEANGSVTSGVGIVGTPPNASTGGTGENDPNSISISYTGPGNITGFQFNPNGLASKGGNVSGGQNGVNVSGSTATYFETLAPGVVFLPSSVPFTVGTNLPNSLAMTDVAATPANPAPTPSAPGTAYWTLQLQFPNNNFTSGKALHFTIGRGEQHASDNTTIDDATADIWGGGVIIPQGTVVSNGMEFSGTVSDGSTFDGFVTNKIGTGYSNYDGYGFLNAQAATAAALPNPGVVSRKVHGTAGTFDIPLPLTGTPGLETRGTGLTNNSYTLIYTFDRNVQNAGTAAITQGTAGAPTTTIGPATNQITVNVTGVASAQHLIITLSNVLDSFGNAMASMPVPMDVLVGDATADRSVNGGDVGLTKSQSGQNVTASNFREDVTADGNINGGDVGLVKSLSGTGLL